MLCQDGVGSMNELILIHNKESKEITLGKVSIFGVIEIETFPSIQVLKKFAMGILGYCLYYDPEVPQVFLEAFEDKEEKNAP